ncbi:putative UDP-glucuronate:xylan alpha-glucuronosyltransferase 5 [Benincasa hispida]|uniref:putative UDP-glucuronate:xylan alpha-glucuronosyltransferase 5 n=1 Tax=Benincasa hispida TaxID=102211 RepID=UPI001900F5B5|nr:putative UDP-glucuronate:xylan alpha-glucuronosyltransferase 5 [Benincasa hispida]
MAFTKTPSSTSKQWFFKFPSQSPSSSSSSSQNLFITSKQSSKRKSSSILMIIFLSFILLCFFLSFTLLSSNTTKPLTIAALDNEFPDQEKIKIGLINISTDDEDEIHHTLQLLGLIEESNRSGIETVTIDFHRIENDDLEWKSLFPEWIDEDEKYNSPKCPDIPMPKTEVYSDLNVVVLKIPCKRGIFRDVFRLQANLAAARVAVASGWVEEEVYRTVYVVFLGKCGAMREIFRCDDLVVKDDRTVEGVWVYKPEMKRLKQKIFMPFGSCQLAPVYARTGREVWRKFMLQKPPKINSTIHHHSKTKPKEAYVTILHSSEAYVCGAIALAQSLLQTSTSKDLLLLVDDSISPNSLQALNAAGWDAMKIDRIRSPFAEKGSYNEWNYSKLRIWQLTMYEKIVFIDADLLVLKNIDQFFGLPQLSAAANNKMRFNSGVMVVEPSACLFEELMEKSFELKPYNGGDQGFLNEVFTWWHRLPSRINYLKIFQKENSENDSDPYAIHYLGLKPWMCYKDYDCNWDMEDHQIFASDSAHAKWWEVYESMPTELQHFCGLTKKMDSRIRKWRRIARNSSFPDGHWKIKINDPRRHRFMDAQ